MGKQAKVTATREEAKASFSKALTTALVQKLGKLPSASSLANQFNFRADGTTTISRETARKWLTGMVIPDLPKMMVLADWLEMDANVFMGTQGNGANPALIADDLVIETIMEILRHMDEKTRTFVLVTVWALRETQAVSMDKLNLSALKRSLIANLIAD
jgi:hypothetical protein